MRSDHVIKDEREHSQTRLRNQTVCAATEIWYFRFINWNSWEIHEKLVSLVLRASIVDRCLPAAGPAHTSMCIYVIVYARRISCAYFSNANPSQRYVLPSSNSAGLASSTEYLNGVYRLREICYLATNEKKYAPTNDTNK